MNQRFTALLDSGASTSLINEKTVESLRLSPISLTSPFLIRAATGHISQVSSQIRIPISISTPESFLCSHSFKIANICIPFILGIPFLHQLNPDINWSDHSFKVSRDIGTLSVTSAPPIADIPNCKSSLCSLCIASLAIPFKECTFHP